MMRADIERGNILISQKPNPGGKWLYKMNAAIIRQQLKEGETVITIAGVNINGVFTPIRDITFQ